MARTWVLETGTKGTGAHVVPLEDALAEREPESDAPAPARRRRPARTAVRGRGGGRRRKGDGETRSTPLPAGHVRKKATGEIGRVKAVDAKAGTATVAWLRAGRTSTVPLSSIARR